MLDSPIAYLHSLANGINANDGTKNCAHCAIRLDEHIAAGRNLSLGPVPTGDAHLTMYPQFKQGNIIRSTSSDNRLINRAPNAEYIEICNLIEPDRKWIIDTSLSSNSKEIRFLKATTDNLKSLLTNLPRRGKDGTAYGLILLTLKDNRRSGHLINYYITKDNSIYFIDSQINELPEQVSQELNMTRYREEIFYLPSQPPEGFKIKRENIDIPIKQETALFEDKREKIALPQMPEFHSTTYLSNIKSKKISDKDAIEFFDFKNTSSLDNNDQNADKFTRLLEQSKGNLVSAKIWSELGICYAFGMGTDQDLNQARLCYTKALEMNEQFTPALRALSYFYLYLPNKDTNQAFNCIKKLTEIDENNAMAWYRLAQFYEGYFIGIRRNSKEAFKCYKKAVEMDDECAIAWGELGLCYNIGVGTKINKVEAQKCYEKQKVLKAKLPEFRPIPPLVKLETQSAPLVQPALTFRSPPVISTVGRLTSNSLVYFPPLNSMVGPGVHFNNAQASNVQPPLNRQPRIVSSYELLFGQLPPANPTIASQPVNLDPSLKTVSVAPNINNQSESKNEVFAVKAEVIKRKLSDEIIDEKSDNKEPTQASKKMRK